MVKKTFKNLKLDNYKYNISLKLAQHVYYVEPISQWNIPQKRQTRWGVEDKRFLKTPRNF